MARPVRNEWLRYDSMNAFEPRFLYSAKKRLMTAAEMRLRISTGHGPSKIAPGDGANLLRETLFRHSDVDADAEHGPVETAVFKINGSFR